MKTLPFFLLMLIIAVSCHNKNNATNTLTAIPLKADAKRVSLNGYCYEQANKMVSDFNADKTSSNPFTDIWLSKKWVDSVGKLLNDEKVADGFRIYFAKAEKSNAIVIVSTLNDGPDSSAESKNDHTDYFKHVSTFLDTCKTCQKSDYNRDVDATLYYTPDCNNSNCPITDNLITCEQAHAAVHNFKKEKINTNSEWFSLSFLNLIKDELDNDEKTNHADGIRIYFAKHCTDNTSTANPAHKGRHALIIITTKADKINGILHHKDYYECIPKPKSGGDNGEQCPNNCNGVTIPKP